MRKGIDVNEIKHRCREAIAAAPRGANRSIADIERYMSDRWLDGAINGAAAKFLKNDKPAQLVGAAMQRVPSIGDPEEPGIINQDDANNISRQDLGDGKKIPATLAAIHTVLSKPEKTNFWIGFDEFRDEIMFHRGDKQWQAFGDEHYSELRMLLPAIGFKEIGRELIRDAVHSVAVKNKFDSAQVWLKQHKWDETPRIERFFIDYFGAEDTKYTRSVGMYMWTALAGRVLNPGCQADMVPILAGEQGIGKSTAIAAIVPSADFFCEIAFTESEDNLARKMRGTLIAEIGELRGLHTRDLETIKAFITRKHEKWTPKFKEFTTTFARRLIFVGTTNASEFLADQTGNRRWLPLNVIMANRDAIVQDRHQLWAEAAHVFKESGIAWSEAQNLATQEHEKFEVTEVWLEEVSAWVSKPDVVDGKVVKQRDMFTSNDVLTDCLKIDLKNIGRKEQMKVGNVLVKLGFKKVRPSIGGNRAWRWSKTE